MTERQLVVLLLISALVLTGCQAAPQAGDFAIYQTGNSSIKLSSEYAATYKLYCINDQFSGRASPLRSSHLKKGEIVGFDLDASQASFAVAGSDRLKLANGRYLWRMIPDSPPNKLLEITGKICEWTGISILIGAIYIGASYVAGSQSDAYFNYN